MEDSFVFDMPAELGLKLVPRHTSNWTTSRGRIILILLQHRKRPIPALEEQTSIS
jgi:hypothetical protein